MDEARTVQTAHCRPVGATIKGAFPAPRTGLPSGSLRTPVALRHAVGSLRPAALLRHHFMETLSPVTLLRHKRVGGAHADVGWQGELNSFLPPSRPPARCRISAWIRSSPCSSLKISAPDTGHRFSLHRAFGASYSRDGFAASASQSSSGDSMDKLYCGSLSTHRVDRSILSFLKTL